MDEPFVSIIIPVKNEAQLLGKCLESIRSLDYPGSKVEIIVADGLSTDGSQDIARQYGAKVVINEKQTVSPGRNIAFSASKGELIAFTDADCVVDSGWIKNAVRYFNNQEVACVGAPNLTPPDERRFAKAVGFVMRQKIFSAGSIHARILREVQEVESIPGCNAVYRKEALEKVMPIDESLLTCDDTELNRRLLDKGYKLLYAPDVFVWHYRRSSPVRLWRQMYRYAIGRLQAGKRDRRMINFRHISAGLGIPLMLLLVVISPALFFAVSGIFLILLFYVVIQALFSEKSFSVALLTPVVVIIMFFSWSSGFMRELIIPLKRVEGK